MPKLSRRYAHFLYGVIQSGVTAGTASAIATFGSFPDGSFVSYWLRSWLISWVVMIPIVLFAAPFIQQLTVTLTSEDV